MFLVREPCGGRGGKQAEWSGNPLFDDLPQVLEITVLNGKLCFYKRGQQGTPCGIPEKPTSGGHGSRNGSCNSLLTKDLGKLTKPGVIKSVIICENLENEALSDVISAWSTLPTYIQEATFYSVEEAIKGQI